MKTKSRSLIDDRIDAKLRMGTGVNAVLQEHAGVWESSQAMSRAKLRLEQLISGSQQAVRVKTVTTKNATLTKKGVEKNLVSLALQSAGIMYSFAIETNNEDLKIYGEIKKTEFKDLREGAKLEKFRHLLETAADNLGSLSDYGLDQELLDEFADAVLLYDFWLSQPTTVKSNRKAATEMLKRQDQILMNFLGFTLDNLMTRYEQSNPAFFLAYHAARKIINTGVRHKSQTGVEGNKAK